MRLPPKIVIAFLLLFLHVSLFGQAKFRIKQFGEESGYTQTGSIAHMKADRAENIWIVRFQDVMRYDGNEFKHIYTGNVNHGMLLRFLEKENGEKMVIDHRNQLFYIEGDTLRTSHLSDTLNALFKNQFCSDFYFDAEDRLHISRPNGLYLTIDPDLNITYPLVEKGLKINGIACMLVPNRLPFIILRGSHKSSDSLSPHFTLLDSAANVLLQIPITQHIDFYPPSIVQLPNGNYLVASGHRHLVEFNTSGYARQIPYESSIIGLLSCRNGDLWISTRAAIHYYKNGVLTKENRELVMENTGSTARMEDFQGGAWIHSEVKGLNHVAFPHHRFLTQENGLINDRINSVEIVDQQLLYGDNGNHVYRLDLETYQTDSFPIPPPASPLLTDLHFEPVHQRLWVAQRGKITYSVKDGWRPLHFDRKIKSSLGSKYYLDGKSTDTITTLLGYGQGHYFYGQDTNITYISPKLPAGVTCLLKHRDSTFVGTETGLLLFLNNQAADLQERFPILKNNIQALTYFKAHIYISIIGVGIFMLKEDQLLPVMHQGMTIRNATFVPQGEDRLWIRNGPQWFLLTPSISVRRPYQIQAFAGDPPFGHKAFTATDSTIYIPTYGKGVMQVDFADLEKHPVVAPKLAFTQVEDNGQLRSWETPLLNLTSNFLAISYNAVNFTHLKVDYRYRIAGLRDEWTLTDKRSQNFIGLPPGQYTFEVQARLARQRWGASQRLHFYLPPPYYQTWWFMALSILAISLLIFLVVRYRIRVANREKNLIIQRLTAEQSALRTKMDPHFVFNVVASLQYLVSRGDNERASTFLEKFSSLMRNTLDQTNMEMISIEKEVRFLAEYIEMEKMRLEDKFDFDIQIDPALDTEMTIPNFLVQPFAENAIQHGLKNKVGKGQLTIDFAKDDKWLRISVVDDGVGFDRTMRAKAQHKTLRASHGIATAKERLRLYNGKAKASYIHIEDRTVQKPEISGTQVSLVIKLKA